MNDVDPGTLIVLIAALMFIWMAIIDMFGPVVAAMLIAFVAWWAGWFG